MENICYNFKITLKVYKKKCKVIDTSKAKADKVSFRFRLKMSLCTYVDNFCLFYT